MDVGNVHTTHRVFDRWHPATSARAALFDEYAFGPFLPSSFDSHLDTVWPSNLVTCALFNTLHSQTYAGIGTRGGISRERFFFYAWLCSLLWYFVPGYLFQALSTFTWVCWIAPNNIVVNQMFGYVSGMGMSMVTFDWAQISWIGRSSIDFSSFLF